MRFLHAFLSIAVVFTAAALALPTRVYNRGLDSRNLNVKWGKNIPEEHKPELESAVNAHHAALDASHPAKAATHAKVWKTWHDDGPDNRMHASVDFHTGSPGGKNKIGDAHHVLKPSKRDSLYGRNLNIKWGKNIPEEHKPELESAVNAHHAALDASHPAKAATHAKVWKTWHDDGPDNRMHASVDFHTGSPGGKNKIGDAHHVLKPSKRDSLYGRNLNIKWGKNIPEEHKPELESAVNAHHAGLPASDPAKAATHAKVWKTWHDDGPDNRMHASVDFHSGSPGGKNKLGDAHHVLKPAKRDRLYDRDLKMKWGKNIPEEHKPELESAVNAHHAALDASHPAKAATHAKVWKTWHDDGPDPRMHASVDFHTGSPGGKNKIGDAHHILKPGARRSFYED